ncbi:type II toxin-antitoxin system Phd/YefM family antitoxin [Indiicoccus explosivorum]|uniref:type II toxin-antitoxin system Phd/YefM family antitoxin n=1 Tax=Indiicoccus explosivorum TaxID=1917864 RepID=UPI001186C73F|nr:type II toxin-antitoxin system Phd/YefM family antitoxin [Indiicoccus explosivorum]
MYRTVNVKMCSISEAKRKFSKLVKEAGDTGEPTFIFNHNRPEAVILSNDAYETMVRKYEAMEEELFYSRLNLRVEEGPGELIPAEQVTGSQHNPFRQLTDEELFD